MAHLVGCCVCVCCVLCFVLSPKQSAVLECHLSHISKNENYELCILAGFFVTTEKKKFLSSVWRVRDHYYDRKKKVLVVCLAGARSLLPPEKIRVLVICLASARLLLQLEKKKF